MPELSGIALRLASVAVMTAMLACVHAAAQSAPIGQIMFWRADAALLPILGYMALRGGIRRGIATQHQKAHALRSLFGALSMGLSFVSLAYLPVANASALAYLAPLFSIPLAAYFLGEALNRTVLISAALGFAGVLAMLWSEMSGPGWAAGGLIGIAAGLGYALTMGFVRVHIKQMTATESAATIAFYFALVSGLIGLASLPFGWAQLTWPLFWSLLGAGLFGGVGHILASEAVARARVSVLAPFDFTGMAWAVGFDVILFNHRPDLASLFGVGAIVVAGLLVAWPRKRARPSADDPQRR